VATQWWKKIEDMFIPFDRFHERVGQTDRQTNTALHDGIDRACIASRGKNQVQHFPHFEVGFRGVSLFSPAVLV